MDERAVTPSLKRVRDAELKLEPTELTDSCEPDLKGGEGEVRGGQEARNGVRKRSRHTKRLKAYTARGS